MRRLAPSFAVALALASTGCMLDFEPFKVRPDASVDRAAVLDGGAMDAHDATVTDKDDASVEDVLHVDQPPPDRSPCAPRGGLVRLAHMATGVGPIHLCTRSRLVHRWTEVTGDDWARGTIGFGQVTTYAALADPVTGRNDPREFLVVSENQPCEGIESMAQGIASLELQLDPASVGMMMLITQSAQGSVPVAALRFLDEKVCTDCARETIEVRAVHAAFGAPYFLDFAFSRATLELLPDGGRGLEARFGRNVGYGASMPGSDGYDCNAAWGSVARADPRMTVNFVVRDPVNNEVARSEPARLKTELLLRTRLATLFFAASPELGSTAQMFVLCYENNSDGGLATCDSFRAEPPAEEDASAPDDVREGAPDDAPSDAPADARDAATPADASAVSPLNG